MRDYIDTYDIRIEFRNSIDVSCTVMYHLRINPFGAYWHQILQNVLEESYNVGPNCEFSGFYIPTGPSPSLHGLAGQGHP